MAPETKKADDKGRALPMLEGPGLPGSEHGDRRTHMTVRGGRDRAQGRWQLREGDRLQTSVLANPHTPVSTAALALMATGGDNTGAHRQVNG